jgi:hypothetical protein
MVPAATMNPARWRLVGSGHPQGLAKARSEAINLVQWLARIANSYVTAGTPEQRTMLAFCAAEPALVTRPFDDDLALELRLASLEMQFREHGKPMPHILDPEEHSPAEVEAWLLVELLHRGVDHTKVSKALPYTIPGLMTGDSEDYSPRSCQQGLAHWRPGSRTPPTFSTPPCEPPAWTMSASLACRRPSVSWACRARGRSGPISGSRPALSKIQNRFFMRMHARRADRRAVKNNRS